jgi:regulator of protease activity HflC (stomatin/prohibitin superfamily)
MKVTDAAAATNNITDYKLAVIQLAMTTMRNAIGSMELDECFQNRDAINAKILVAMTEATAPWGVMVTRYEIKDITPPQTIREDMEKQMTAEREKRSVILTAEGVKSAAITVAEGQKRARVLDAEAAKSEQVLAAEASKESQILTAMGKAEAIRLVAEADAGALLVVGNVANTEGGQSAVMLTLAQNAITAHQAIASDSTVVLTDGKTGENIANTVAQAIAVSSSLKL